MTLTELCLYDDVDIVNQFKHVFMLQRLKS